MPDLEKPAVILRSGRHGGLGVVRSLGRLGVPVFAVDSNPRMLAFASRYCRGSFVWDFDQVSLEETVEYLLNLGRKIGRSPVLIPTIDAAALFVSRHSSILREQFTFPVMPPDLVHTLYSKKEMHFLAQRMSVPTPKTFFPASPLDVVEFSKTAMFPIIIKSVEANEAENLAGKQKFIVWRKQELLDYYHVMENPGKPNVMLQEYIPGGDEASWMFNGYFDQNSRCLFGLTGRKIRQHRPHAGIASLGVCDHNEKVADTTARFMSAIGYSGILDIGYRYDARDGLHKVFDVNPRIGCTFRLFVTDNGMDVARAMYLDLSGGEVSAGRALGGRKWIVEDLDLVSAFLYWRAGDLSLWQWMKSFRGVRESALFAQDDVRPALRALIDDTRKLLRMAI